MQVTFHLSSKWTHITGSSNVDLSGKITATSGDSWWIGHIDSTTLFSDSNRVCRNGFNRSNSAGSKVLFTGGKIGGFTIDADEIKSTNLLLDSNNEKITVGFFKRRNNTRWWDMITLLQWVKPHLDNQPPWVPYSVWTQPYQHLNYSKMLIINLYLIIVV